MRSDVVSLTSVEKAQKGNFFSQHLSMTLWHSLAHIPQRSETRSDKPDNASNKLIFSETLSPWRNEIPQRKTITVLMITIKIIIIIILITILCASMGI